MRRRLEGIEGAVADVARQTDAALPEILRLFAEEATHDVRAAWPVKTGRSRDALGVEVAGRSVAIVCDIRYASFIHEKGLTGPTYVVRIVEHVQRNIDQIGARVSRRLGAAA